MVDGISTLDVAGVWDGLAWGRICEIALEVVALNRFAVVFVRMVQR
jgi:hypothetical protein